MIVIDLDKIYKDGKLFGHEVYRVDIGRRETSVILYEYEGKTWLIRIKFDFVLNALIITVDKINTKKQCGVTSLWGFDEIFSLKDGIVYCAFDYIVEKLIKEVKRLAGE